MAAFFHKELFSQPLYASGRVVRFVEIGDDEGVLQTDDEDLISSIRSAIVRHVGGVSEITQEEFKDAKKKPVKRLLVPQPKPPPQPNQDPFRLGSRLKSKPVPLEDRVAKAAATDSAEKKPVEPPPKPKIDPVQNRPTPVKAKSIRKEITVDPPLALT